MLISDLITSFIQSGDNLNVLLLKLILKLSNTTYVDCPDKYPGEGMVTTWIFL